MLAVLLSFKNVDSFFRIEFGSKVTVWGSSRLRDLPLDLIDLYIVSSCRAEALGATLAAV